PTGSEAFPAMEPETGFAYVIARGNYSPTEVRSLLVEVENEILQVQGVQDVIMTFGGGDGFATGNSPPDTTGMFQLKLITCNDTEKLALTSKHVRARVADFSGFELQIRAAEEGPPAGKAINLRIESTVYADLAPAVGKVRDYIENELGDAIDVEDG